MHTDIKVNGTLTHSVTYNLTHSASLYGIECYIDGADHSLDTNYCYVRNITSDGEFAKELLYKLAQGEVLPIHVADIIQDLYS